MDGQQDKLFGAKSSGKKAAITPRAGEERRKQNNECTYPIFKSKHLAEKEYTE